MDKVIAECSLADLVEDPLVGLLMESDGVDRRSIELLFEQIAQERVRAVHGLRPRLQDEETARCSLC
jgi:hypothetical protein